MMMNDLSFFRGRWKSVLFNALWRHKLQWRHTHNWLIRVCKECTFHWCIDCGKYCCLICRGRKLLGWPSYIANMPNVYTSTLFSVFKMLFPAFPDHFGIPTFPCECSPCVNITLMHGTNQCRRCFIKPPFFFHNSLKRWSIYMKFLLVVAEEILIQNTSTKYGSY